MTNLSISVYLSDKEYVEYVKDESELLEKFVEHVRKFSPDFLVGYFSDGFDLPYLAVRAKKNKVKKIAFKTKRSDKTFDLTSVEINKNLDDLL